MKESDLFEPVKQFLLSTMNCEKVYAEVVDLDVVGKHGNVYIGIEMKTSLNFKVIEQAERRKHLVDYMFILVPKPKSYHSQMIMDWLGHLGVGLMYYDEKNRYSDKVSIYSWGKRQRSARKYKIADYIDDELDSINIGGVKGGESITPYKNTIDKIKHTLYMEPKGLTVEEILEQVQTHYTTPKPSVAATLKEQWNLEWCEFEKVNGKWVYRMKEEYREPYITEYRALSSEIRQLRRANR